MTRFAEYEAYDALGLAELVRRRQVSAGELVEAAIERIAARNPALNAVVHTRFDRARAEAAAPPPGRPFGGVPFLLKDLNSALTGEPLTDGCRLLARFVPPRDGELIIRHKAAGLVVLGKSNTPEFGILPVTEPLLFGATRNPWQLEHTPGGSSGGAAAAVAAGMVPLAHGSDGGGSIRIPASCCGLFGLKPSRGRNPLGPVLSEGWSGLVQEHGISRSVRDSAALLDATAGPEPGAPFVIQPPERPFLAEVGRDPGRLRIAFTARSLFGETTHLDCRAAVEDAARVCEGLGHLVEEEHPGIDRDALRHAMLAIVAVNTARAIDLAGEAVGRRPTPRDFEPETWLLGQIGRAMGAVDFQAALDALHAGRLALAAFFARHDRLLTPTLAHPPMRVGALAASSGERAVMAVLRATPVKRALRATLERMAAEVFEGTGNTMLANQTGQPAMSVPLWWNAAGLPIGVQFVARFGEEATLFRLASQLEQARPWVHRRPAGFSDRRA